jgi:hypothetical protein
VRDPVRLVLLDRVGETVGVGSLTAWEGINGWFVYRHPTHAAPVTVCGSYLRVFDARVRVGTGTAWPVTLRPGDSLDACVNLILRDDDHL